MLAIVLYAIVCPSVAWLIASAVSWKTEQPIGFYLAAAVPAVVLLGKASIDMAARWSSAHGVAMSTSAGAFLSAVPLAMCVSPALEAVADVNQRYHRDAISTKGAFVAVAAILLLCFGSLLVPKGTWLRASAVVRWAARAATLLLAILVGLGLLRSGSFPNVEQYPSGLRELPVGFPGIREDLPSPPPHSSGLLPTSWVPPNDPPARILPGSPGERTQQRGELTIVQSCEVDECWLRIADGASPPAREGAERQAVRQRWDVSFDLLVDAGNAVIYVRKWPGDTVEQVFRKVDGEWLVLYYDVSSILHSTSPPPFWIWVGAASLLVMVILWVARSLAHRRQRVFDSAREGVMGLDGVIAFDNLPSVRLLSEPPPGTIPSGPVVVLFGTAPGPGPLPPLATVSASAVVPGKLSEHREMGAFRVFCRDAGILGVAFLGGAPLAVAIVRSLF